MRALVLIALAAGLWLAAARTSDAALLALAGGVALMTAGSWAVARVQARLLDARVNVGMGADDAQSDPSDPAGSVSHAGPEAGADVLPEVPRGSEATFFLAVANRSVLPVGSFDVGLSVARRRDPGNTEVVELGGTASGRSELRVPLSCDAAHCGVLKCRVTSLGAHDPLGVFHARRDVGAMPGASLLVVPRRERTMRVDVEADAPGAASAAEAALAGAREASGETRGSGEPEPPDVDRLRAWVPGDPLHSVHWKLSARLGETVVKQYEQTPEETLELRCNLEWDVPRADGGDGSRPAAPHAKPQLGPDVERETEGNAVGGDAVKEPDADGLDAFFEAACALSAGLLAAGVAHVVSWQGALPGRVGVSGEDDVAVLGRSLAFGARPQHRQGKTRGNAVEGHGSPSDPHVLTLDLNLKLWHEGRPVACLAGGAERVTIPGRAVRDDG